MIAALDAVTGADAPPTLRDVARSAARANPNAPLAYAIVATDLADLRAKLAAPPAAVEVEQRDLSRYDALLGGGEVA